MTMNGLSPDLGFPHISRDPDRGYIENDPILRLPNGKVLHGQHGLMDIRAEITSAGHGAGVLDSPLLRDIINNR